jgi:hypothetical protein
MNPDPWPTDAVERKAWISSLVRDIDHQGRQGRYGLLTEVVRTAWPSWSAQDQ